jgi:hypothetical protein
MQITLHCYLVGPFPAFSYAFLFGLQTCGKIFPSGFLPGLALKILYKIKLVRLQNSYIDLYNNPAFQIVYLMSYLKK